MTTIFNIDNHINDFTENLNIDELYDRKKNADIQKLEVFNKILNRIHVRIKLTSRRSDEKNCWFVVPEIILGVTHFDHATCISYVIDKLKMNGFNVFYYHPNTLHISWDHWVPKYVRDELKKKTGIVVDEFGQRVEDSVAIENVKREFPKIPEKEKFTPIDSYKPKGIF
jgi:hypothetical protein